MKYILLVLACVVSLTVEAQGAIQKPKEWYENFFITKGMTPMPDPRKYLPNPAKENEGRFLTDSVIYEEGKVMRGTLRGDTAMADADFSVEYLLKRFSPAVGKELSKEKYPILDVLIAGVTHDSYRSIKKAKKAFGRRRPYQHFKEGTPVPQDENPNDTTSYPSGHSIKAWSAALTLVTIFPERENEILKVGYELGQSRVILGFHYQSDVDAGRVAASAAYARLWADETFRKQVELAIQEQNK